MSKKITTIIIGGGAAGFFGAIACAEANPSQKVIILEKAKQVLSKVRISGGGRCNVTHACFEPAALINHYPRGSKELRGPFNRFQPKDTIEWFESRGVQLKVESDGRMFPITDSSETIINCLLSQAKAKGVELRNESGVNEIVPKDGGYLLTLSDDSQLYCDKLLIASGSNPKMHSLIKGLGHKIVEPVPSLFTFNIQDSPLLELAGISVPKAHVKIIGTNLEQTGPLLITHWGFSGPAVLKLSAWGARTLHSMSYKGTISINWLPEIKQEKLRELLTAYKNSHPTRLVNGDAPVELPRNLWKKLTGEFQMRWSELSKKELQRIIDRLLGDTYSINGKSTYKDEFVTCGGVALEEVDFKTMESKLSPGLYFAGEVLDVDGVTGGFNFQNAWTTSWIAAQAISKADS